MILDWEIRPPLGAKAKDVVDHNPLCVVDGATKSDSVTDSVFTKKTSFFNQSQNMVRCVRYVEVPFSLELGSRERAMLGVKTKGGPRFVTLIQV